MLNRLSGIVLEADVTLVVPRILKVNQCKFQVDLCTVVLGADTTNVKLVDAGRLLSDTIRQYMYDIGIEDGLSALGYTTADIPELVLGTMTQVSGNIVGAVLMTVIV